MVPVSVTLLLPEPAKVTPVVPAVTVSAPEATDSVAVTVAPPASTSAIDSPVPCKVSAVCSVAEIPERETPEGRFLDLCVGILGQRYYEGSSRRAAARFGERSVQSTSTVTPAAFTS